MNPLGEDSGESSGNVKYATKRTSSRSTGGVDRSDLNMAGEAGAIIGALFTVDALALLERDAVKEMERRDSLLRRVSGWDPRSLPEEEQRTIFPRRDRQVWPGYMVKQNLSFWKDLVTRAKQVP